jgi:putative SOS response-associated peptidase YedK
MCGRYTLIHPERLPIDFPRYRHTEYRLPRYNVAPTQEVLGVLNDGTSRVRVLHWGIG